VRRHSVEGDADNVEHVEYALSAVVIHAGYTLNSGHYFSYAVERGGLDPSSDSGGGSSSGGSSSSGSSSEADPAAAAAGGGVGGSAAAGVGSNAQWRLYNDSTVVGSSREALANSTSTVAANTPYVYFFERVSMLEQLAAESADVQLPPLAPHLWEAVCHDNQQHEREIAAGPSKTPAVGAGGGSLFSAPNNQMLNSPAFQALMTQFQSSSGAVSVQAPKPVKLAKAGEKAPTNEQLKAAIYLAAQSQAAGGAVGGIDATPTTTHHVSFEQLLKQQAQPFTVHKSPAAGPLTISAGKVSKPPKAALGAIRTAFASGTGRVRGPKGDTHDNDVLEMPCFRFNQYIKEHGLSDKEVKEMKEARRRMKNRLYAKRSRGRKTTTKT
jgi:hypothetical protein